MRKIISATLLAIALIYGCIQGALWQYDRYETRHDRNQLIIANSSKSVIPESQIATAINSNKSEKIAWRTLRLNGNFQPEKELLIRNRYHEGKYGFGVVTLFKSNSGEMYWVDRGWVIAGENAQTPPVTQKVNDQAVEITTRIRVESLENQIKGSVFAVPGSTNTQLQKWNSEQVVSTAPVYLDLISSSNPSFIPNIPAELPEISDGPHLAYSFQWLLFSLLVIFAWYLVVKEERQVHPEKL